MQTYSAGRRATISAMAAIVFTFGIAERAQAAKFLGLGDLAGEPFSSIAAGVSADGSVVVGTGLSTSGVEAFRWTSGSGMVGLGELTGGDFLSFAAGVSADGSVVVGGSNSASGSEGFRRTSGGGMVGLGDLNGGPFFSNALGVSADGSVVVGRGTSASGFFEPFIWDETNGMRSVKDVISPSVGAALNGWTLQRANAISADGRTVVGTGQDPSGNAQAWLAYLPDQVFWLPATSGVWDAATNWSGPFGIEPGDSVVIEPAGSLTVLGPTTSATVAQLVIGGGSGIATLELQTGGTIATPTVAIDYTGILTGDGTINGSVLSQGTVLADNVTITGTLTNLQDGVVEGDGRVNASLDNGSFGLVRARAGEHLQIIGASHTNNGQIEAIGTANELAEIEFRGTLANAASTGLITGRNAVMRFNNGLSNKGSLALTGGTNDVFGDIDNSGSIVVSGGGAATFYDDVKQSGTLRVSQVGSTTSTAVFLGDFTGDGGSTGGGDIFFEGDLRPGNSPAQVTYENNVFLGSGSTLEIELGGLTPGAQHDKIIVDGSFALDGTLQVSLINSFTPQAGNSFDILDWDDLAGTFDTLALPTLTGSLIWDTDELYTTGVLAVVAPGLPGDYNQNGSVDAADYVVWRKTGGTPDGYNTWRTNFGRTAASGATAGPASSAGATGSASAAVPEPRAMVLFTIGLASLLFRRCSDSLFRSA